MSLITILLFFIYTYGLGFSITFFLKNSENFLERNLIRVGVGLGFFCVLGIIFNFLRIPLNWWIFLILSLIFPLFYIVKNRSKIKIKSKINKADIYIFIVLILFLLTLFMYAKGAFVYPYLEDDDSWAHAKSIKYVAIEKTAFEPGEAEGIGGHGMFHFIDPYPPAYDILFAILHQTSASLMWTMKFFNALIISLGIIFFYFFAKEFMNSRKKALFAAFVLASIPCYLTHFIWAHSLALTLFFPAMYCLERIKYDKKWIYAMMIMVSSILLTQPTQAVKLVLMIFIYIVIKSILQKRILKFELISLITGGLLSLVWWYNKWKGVVGGEIAGHDGGVKEVGAGFLAGLVVKIKKAFLWDAGTASRAYDFNDFFVAKSQGLINNTIGIGIIISILVILSLVYIAIRHKFLLKEKNHWITITLFWFLFTFLGVNSVTFRLPIGLFPFRFWMLLAIPVSILAAEGLWFLFKIGKKYGTNKIIILILIIIGVLFTSAHQKYSVNTSIWPPGVLWSSMEEVKGYLWLKTLPPNTKVLPLCGQGDKKVIGLDMLVYSWKDEGAVEYKQLDQRINMTANDFNSWLKTRKYQYVIVDGYCARDEIYGINKTNEKVNEYISSGLFQPVHQTQGVVIFKVI